MLPGDMHESYEDFFYRVTAKRAFPYQLRYAANPFSPLLLTVPTGLGKTDAVLIPWLHALSLDNSNAPTRLIVVLPRQNLTRQTALNARKRIESAGLTGRVDVIELMAGSEDNKERLRPAQPTIVVATQDLYFSRALNRGYARRPTQWPVDFALYNQDCLVILDEVQLMDDALATSAQLAAFRRKFCTFGSAPCVWMSATVNPAWLNTIDFPDAPPQLRLEEEDLACEIVRRRFKAPKALAPAPEDCREPGGCAAFLLNHHQPGTRSLVIANTVQRAREIYAALQARFPSAILLHSRFRPADRRAHSDALLNEIPPEGQIAVSTQVLEAGVDVSAHLLVTDLAPWGSLVQRFGRVNRYGDDAESAIWWVDRPAHSKQKDPAAPYSQEELDRAAARLAGMQSAAPSALPAEDGPAPWRHVLRRADLLDLFDTSPDLSGNNLDVSRFIRATEDKDAYLVWRAWQGDGAPSPASHEFADDELCPVSLPEFREFAARHDVYTWNFAADQWTQVDKDRLHPGMRAVVRETDGGYTLEQGWSPDSKLKVQPCASLEESVEGDSSDSQTFRNYRQTLSAHTSRVVEELETLLNRIASAAPFAAELRKAALLHDWGKAHPVFQETLHRHDPSPDLLAKQVGTGSHSRKHFRHELASALAILATGESDLAAYLVAAHHGRVRLSIRSMPGERDAAGGQRTARGIRDGDRLPACELADGVALPEITLSLDLMEFGTPGGSWTERALRLLHRLGPFRLAYLEMLLRAADEAASADPRLEAGVCAK